MKRSSPVLLDGKGVWNVVEDANHTLWVGSLNMLYSIQLTPKGAIASQPTVRYSVPFGVTNAMWVDSRKDLWIGTSSMGLFKFDPKAQKFSNIRPNKSNPKALPSNNVTSILEDEIGKIWIGTEYDGIVQLVDFEKNEFLKFPNPSNQFRASNSLLKDKQGNIWMSTDNGIFQFTPQKQFNHFSLEDGLQNKEFNINASMVSIKGDMYLGGTEGFNYFKPDAIPFNTKVPRVYITELKLFNHSLVENIPFQEQVYLTKPAYLTSDITLNYEDNVFGITFSALDYLSPSQNKFQYKLEGFDKEWFIVEAAKRSVTYTNLPPGDFTFQVKGTNSDGVWSKETAKLTIHVLPPWWMTWWFRALLWVFGISGLLAFYFWRTYSIKKKNQELKELVKIKTSELKSANEELLEINEEMLITNERLEAQNLEVSRKSDRILEQQNKIIEQNAELNTLNETKDKFFSIIAHDLRNPVSALHALAGQLNQNFKSFPESEKEQYVRMMLDSTTNLKKLTLDLLDWATSQTKHYLIDLKPVNVHESIEKTILALSSQAQQKNILLNHPSSSPVWVVADGKMLETVIRNLTSNAIKYSPNGSVVSIDSELAENGMVKITVEDHGVGMSESQAKNLFSLEKIESTLGTQNEKGVGLGLIICKEFVALNHGRIEVESEISVGTKVHVYLPWAEKFTDAVLQVPEKTEPMVQTSVPVIPWPKNPEIAAFANRKLLIIDDEPSARKVLRGYLGEHFEIYEAENGANGLEMAQNVFPEIIICDLNMPVMNGFEFCAQLK
ncbi:MAG: response regulator, partial [Cytophagales bacterium]|nr:response regulator [Cytophagales bacterium]